MKLMNPMQFFRQVRQEIGRVVWPTRDEAFKITLLVIVMSLVAGAALFVIDQALMHSVNFAARLGG